MKKEQICCSICNSKTSRNPCLYCASTSRDRSQIYVVENDSDIHRVEKTRLYTGLYHILHGSLAPARGIGPDELMLANLMPRLAPKNDEVEVKKIIVAIRGGVTANYIERLLEPLDIEIRRIEIETEDDSETELIH